MAVFAARNLLNPSDLTRIVAWAQAFDETAESTNTIDSLLVLQSICFEWVEAVWHLGKGARKGQSHDWPACPK